MSEAKKRKVHAPEFRAKVGLEALRGAKTVNQIGQDYAFHPVQIGLWKKQIQTQAKTLFQGKQTRACAGGGAPGARIAVWRDRQTENGTGLAEKKVRDQPAMIPPKRVFQKAR